MLRPRQIDLTTLDRRDDQNQQDAEQHPLGGVRQVGGRDVKAQRVPDAVSGEYGALDSGLSRKIERLQSFRGMRSSEGVSSTKIRLLAPQRPRTESAQECRSDLAEAAQLSGSCSCPSGTRWDR